jgi:hypothetical protein
MSRVGFEPTTPVLERAKTVHALDRAATVIGDAHVYFYWINIINLNQKQIFLTQFQYILGFLDLASLVFWNTKLKSNGDKTSPWFKPFISREYMGRCLPYWLYYKFHWNTL